MQSREVFGFTSHKSGEHNAKTEINISQAITNIHTEKPPQVLPCEGMSTNNVIQSMFLELVFFLSSTVLVCE